MQDGSGDATTNVLQCVSDTYQDSQDAREANLRSFLLVICGGMIFFMQSGFAMMCAGSVRLKNVQNTMLKNLLDACGAALAFYLIGTFFSVANGGIFQRRCIIEESKSKMVTNVSSFLIVFAFQTSRQLLQSINQVMLLPLEAICPIQMRVLGRPLLA